ncbi:helix-turn-helix transcriptional regulator [Deinococcus soli (ex Cha et al. 2016)]|uniref:Transcriptional regulator with XRE-family HTH domain n=2 Tax=Deinococcus soli (ex Cha et al. 2016) TaxID=1309411 RepID=A0AAE3XDF0_9DEIO|nr:helix-turn-helix transcriptional regulator [Deinococcus soli (ex Cha et al. 2016)]MDR6219206.1 transcriptional regulator with XRE-family HTH domain [Deinococcus soli (ex Cha et al. 2016)]MDR6329455.1 transcriptional regulator with XRE-family HTH domain [Deinococcus soli (ex Cha et al. 2016)]MDR6752115.1 transcriptional regulator with XRE-family HTH domain [Deinococcus soli (ex Cha et al. 2016)]
MNDHIRQQVRNIMKERGITQQQLADLTGIQRPNVTRLLSGTSGQVPDNWQRILDALELDLITSPKPEDQR